MKDITLQQANEFSKGTLVERLGIEFLTIEEQMITGRMPVNNHTVQPFGILHGGASVSLAETLGSFGSLMLINRETHLAFGLEINANHVKSVKEGYVIGKAHIIHQGKKTHIWDIRIYNDKEELVCISRLTIAIVEKSK